MEFGNKHMTEREDARQKLTDAIIAHDEPLALKHAISENITIGIVELAKKTLKKLQSSDENYPAARRIYGNILAKADRGVLDTVITSPIGEDVVLDAKCEIGSRDLLKAIEVGDLESVKVSARKQIIREVLNEDHLKLAIKKHELEVLLHKPRTKAPLKDKSKKAETHICEATQIVQILFRHAEKPMLEALQPGASWSVKELIKEEFDIREIGKNHPLNRWLT